MKRIVSNMYLFYVLFAALGLGLEGLVLVLLVLIQDWIVDGKELLMDHQ